MDFLDPNKKRNRKIRLTIGHALMVTLVVIGTYLLVLAAYGYTFNSHGVVSQNGLIFIDSAPDGATITINGVERNERTNTRLALPEGVYTLQISKQGYRTWSRKFELEGGKVERFTYPAIYLTELKPQEIQTIDKKYDFVSESLDRRFIVLGQKDVLNKLNIFDLGKRQNKVPTSKTIDLPGDLMNSSKKNISLSLLEWSTDNKNFLALHKFAGGQEFVVINIDKPEQSFNVNKAIGRNPSDVKLFDKGIKKLYIHDTKTKTLETVEIASKKFTEVSKNVISFKPHGDNIVFMALQSQVDKKKADMTLLQDNQKYKIRQITTGTKIPLDFARSGHDWYAIFAAQDERKTYIYKNPIDYLKNNNDPDKTSALALKSLGNINQVSFSQNTRFIMAQSGQYINVFDTETDRRYAYNVKQKFDKGSELNWMDGHRMITHSGGKVLIFDFNGINFQSMIASDAGQEIMFDRDYTEMYTVGNSNTAKKFGLFLTPLRLDSDK